MRYFFAFIIFALLLTGFDAAKHVYGAALMKDTQGQMAAMDCCPDEKGSQHKQTDMACHYCCAALLGFGADKLSFLLPPPPAFQAIAARFNISKLTYSLFRPPPFLSLKT